MPTYKVKHQGKVKSVNYDGANPTKAELRSILESTPIKPVFDYPPSASLERPNPEKYYPKDWLEKLDPHARSLERGDRNMFTVDLSQSTNKAVDRAASGGDDEAARKWKAQKLGFASGAAESALNMLGAPESVLMGAPKIFRQRMADYPASSINPRLAPDMVEVGAEEAYNSSFPKNYGRSAEELGYESVMRNRGRHLVNDETGSIGKNIRHDKRGHISGRYIKKNIPIEPDSFDIESAQPYVEPEKIDYVKQMLDSLKLADEQKKLRGLSPRRK